MTPFQTMLDKILHRTKRDVALAGAMVGSVTAMQHLFPVIERYSTLRVDFYGGTWSWWEYVPCEPHSGVWRDFLKWYHGRPQSECFVMGMRDGAQMFRRCDIRSYIIRYAEREKRSPGDTRSIE